MKLLIKTLQIIAYVYLAGSIIIVLYFSFFGERVIEYLAENLVVDEDYVKSDAIVLLGGQEGYKRLVRAANLYNNGYGDMIINSGNGNDEEAKKLFKKVKLTDEDYINESASTTTYENALFAKEVVEENGYNSIIIVSTPQQSARARWIFERVFKKTDIMITSAIALDSNYVPEDLQDSKYTKEQFTIEFVKRLYYYIKYSGE